MGNVLLQGQDSDVWEKPDRLDLIVVKHRKNESLLSAWLSDRFVHWYHQTISYRVKVSVMQLRQKAVLVEHHTGKLI
jgi:hypothetical protein